MDVTTAPRRWQLPPAAAFWLIALTMIVALFTSAAPAPIYPVYQQLWGFSAFTLTVVFAVYVVALLTTLLTVGAISDHVGRRPVLAVALVLLIASMGLFIGADGVPDLIAARVLQGLATGALVGTMSATMLDLQPSERLGSIVNGSGPGVGLALGAAGAGLLVQYAPAPRVLTFEASALLLTVLLIGLVFVPESSGRIGFTSRRHLATSLLPSIALPRGIRPVFLSAAPAMLATWSLGGMQLSLGSTVVANLFAVDNRAAAGVMLGLFFVAAAVSAAATHSLRPNTKLLVGYPALFIGVCMTCASVLTTSVAVFLIGTIVSGVGFGAGFGGAITAIGAAAAPQERGQVFSAVFVVSYLGFSIPAVVAGIAVGRIGLRSTTVGYAVYVMLLVIVASAAAVAMSRRARRLVVAPAAPDTVCATAGG